jgi:signal transduction histidine kinase
VRDENKPREQLVAELQVLRQNTTAEEIAAVKRRLAVERIRAEAMAMRQSGDLVKIMGMMWQEMVGLGIDIFRLNIRFMEGDQKSARIGRSYYTIPNPRRYGISWTSPLLVEFNEQMTVGEITSSGPRDEKIIAAWQRGEVLSTLVTADEIARRTEFMGNFWGFDQPMPLEENEKKDGVHIYAPFQYGIVGFRVDAMSEEYLITTRELTEALSLGYIRYLDFQLLENQKMDLEENLRLLRDTQTQMVMQEKMASLGDLVSGVAHEMNTPLGAVGSMHNTLMRATDKLQKTLVDRFPDACRETPSVQSVFGIMAEANRVIAEGIGRVSGIVESLRNFAHLDEAEFQFSDVHEGLDSALTLLAGQIDDGITVNKSYGDIEPVYCSPGQLNQVFMHLLKNALQAIEGVGEIAIATSTVNDSVCIHIGDTGKGIAPERLERIFDFDFHASGQRMKMGFGLSIDYKIIQEHKGEISIESGVDKGTAVSILLPLRKVDPT